MAPSDDVGLDELRARFPDEASCARFIESLRWPRGFQCQQCENVGDPFRFANRPYVHRCRRCRAETSLTAGTVFARSRLALVDWFVGAWLAVTHPRGVEPRVLQRALSIGRYETAYLTAQRLRAAMVPLDEELLGEDAVVPGTLVRARGRVVLVLIGLSGQVKLRALPSPALEEVEAVLGRYLAPGAELATEAEPLGAAATYGGFDVVQLENQERAQLAELVQRLETWLARPGAGPGTKQLQGELNELAFRIAYEGDPAAGFRDLLSNALGVPAPTAADLYAGRWVHPNPRRRVRPR